MLADGPHGRRLTAAEQMRLAKLEQQLRDDDPQLMETFDDATPSRSSPPRSTVPGWAYPLGVATIASVSVMLAVVLGGAVAIAAALVGTFAGWQYLRRRRLRF